jgi:hypothetical protein
MEHNNNTKIDFFLHKKRNLIKLIDKFNYIIEIFTSLLDKECCSSESLYYIDKVNFYESEKKQIQQKINNCDENMHKFCSHQYIEDVIDLSPETSRYIKYCIICECTESV